MLVFDLALQVLFLYQVARLSKFWRGDVPPRIHTVLGAAGYEGAKTLIAIRGSRHATLAAPVPGATTGRLTCN